MAVPIDIIQQIFIKVDFLTQIRLHQVSKLFYSKLQIRNFYKIDQKYLELLSDSILHNYPYIRKLHIIKSGITDVGYLTNLQKLNVVTDQIFNINNKFLSNLNLRKLICNGNSNLIQIDHMSNLKILYADYSKITDATLKNISLKKLSVNDCKLVTNINHMTELNTLYARGDCKITDDGLVGLTNLTSLDVRNNRNIKSINHLTNLKILNAAYCRITDDDIKNLDLEELNVTDNRNIENINHMQNLKKLIADFTCGINDSGIRDLRKLRVLSVSYNSYIANANHLTNLTELYANSTSKYGRHLSSISDKGIANLFNLKILECNGNSYVSNLNHMTKLEILRAKKSAICTDGIKNLNLIEISASHKSELDLSHMTRLKKIDNIIIRQ